jgi:hypothetical protein
MTAYHDETENLMASAPARKGNWMQTFIGRQFWPADPRADEIDIRDIAHALSMQCRYAGHCTQFYSVAEHCVLLANAIPEQKLWALLHDASEAYLVDVPRPVKPSLTGYAALEDRIMAQVAIQFNLLPFTVTPAIVKDYDFRMLVDEKAQNMRPGLRWGSIDGLDPVGVTLQFWTPEQAENEFLRVYFDLSRKELKK